jgi:hypothetical protein
VAEPLPHEVEKLFWDTDPATIDLDRHGDYVMERIMSRGGWEAMCWLRRTFSQRRLADFLLRKGARLAPRERAYWALVAGVDVPTGQGGARPPWAGP